MVIECIMCNDRSVQKLFFLMTDLPGLHYIKFTNCHFFLHKNNWSIYSLYLCFVIPQGGAYSAANKGGPDPRGVSIFWQHQVRHLWDRGVPSVGSGLWLGAVVPIPQPTKVLVDTTQPHSSNQVNRGSVVSQYRYAGAVLIINKFDLRHVEEGWIRSPLKLVIFK